MKKILFLMVTSSICFASLADAGIEPLWRRVPAHYHLVPLIDHSISDYALDRLSPLHTRRLDDDGPSRTRCRFASNPAIAAASTDAEWPCPTTSTSVTLTIGPPQSRHPSPSLIEAPGYERHPPSFFRTLRVLTALVDNTHQKEYS
jgi:hypothetical protein